MVALEGDKNLATTSYKNAMELTETIDTFSPKIAHLTTFNFELNTCKELLDLPHISTTGGVQKAVAIETAEDVRSINTLALGRKVIISFHTRGLLHHKEHEKDLPVERMRAKYDGVYAYQASIARHLQIDMSVDSGKRDAL
jgi:hypothetical protein